MKPDIKNHKGRFFKHIERTADCWIWKAAKNEHGYGIFRIYPKNYLAHRFVYMLVYGDIPQTLFVLHKCDNPSCVNPNHLFLGTQKDNMVDCKQKGRVKTVGHLFYGEDHYNSKLKESEIWLIFRVANLTKFPHHKMAKMFRVNTTTIQRIIYKKTWNHSTGEYNYKKRKPRKH